MIYIHTKHNGTLAQNVPKKHNKSKVFVKVQKQTLVDTQTK